MHKIVFGLLLMLAACAAYAKEIDPWADVRPLTTQVSLQETHWNPDWTLTEQYRTDGPYLDYGCNFQDDLEDPMVVVFRQVQLSPNSAGWFAKGITRVQYENDMVRDKICH